MSGRAAERFGGVTIIIDGHGSKNNVAGAKTFDSHLVRKTERSSVEVGRQPAGEITESPRDHPVHVVDCVGRTLLDNPAWTRTADHGVARWRAGLAKYRWALNLPTDVMTSPGRHVLISEGLVTDRPDLVPLIEMDGAMMPHFMNCESDVDAAIAEPCHPDGHGRGGRRGRTSPDRPPPAVTTPARS